SGDLEPAHRCLQKVVVITFRCFGEKLVDLVWRQMRNFRSASASGKNGECVAIQIGQMDGHLGVFRGHGLVLDLSSWGTAGVGGETMQVEYQWVDWGAWHAAAWRRMT